MLRFPKWLLILIAAVIFGGALSAFPNLLTREQAESLPTWLPRDQINLGLDLQGGAHLLLEVDVAAVMDEQLKDLRSGIARTLRDDGVRRFSRPRIVDGAIVVRITNAEDVAPARSALRGLATQVNTGIGLQPDLEVTEIDDQTLELRYTEVAVNDRRSQVVRQSLEIVRRRIDEVGTREPTIQRQGEDRILLQLPGVDDPERIKRLLGTTAQMNFHLACSESSVPDAMAGRVPPRCMLSRDASEVFSDGSPRMHLLERREMLSGESLVNAQPGTDGRTGEPVVTFRLDTAGAKRFGDVTTDNVGRIFAIVLDDEVISAPQIREPILGGSGQISGNFTFQSANDLALLIRAGALPAPLTILEERTVGPGLGADSIAAGRVASIIGLSLVVVFMIAVYGLFGIMANVALLVNMLLIASVLSVLQATLTLPGIAGIVLTIGMAVDANVLIFERIREEVRNGRTPISAVDAGYARAITTIIDANVTTLIAAVLLFQFGSGPIRGFAVTLSIGIIASMFSAIMLTRLMVVTWLRRTRPSTITI